MWGRIYAECQTLSLSRYDATKNENVDHRNNTSAAEKFMREFLIKFIDFQLPPEIFRPKAFMSKGALNHRFCIQSYSTHATNSFSPYTRSLIRSLQEICFSRINECLKLSTSAWQFSEHI
jgi:hypothetical protein